jgi:arylsulfatase A-like enzyme
MTGKHPARLHITDWIGGTQRGRLLPAAYEPCLPLEEFTLAEAFRAAGYATASIGKWHLGDRGHYPEDQGFDVNVAGHAAGHPASYFYPYTNERKTWDVPGLAGGGPGEYLTDRLTDEAIRFIERNRGRPFFLFLSHYAVHTPIQARADLRAEYERRRASMSPPGRPATVGERTSQTRQVQDDPAYAAMVASVDEGVGRLMQTLERLELSSSTIVVFTSDNGGLSTLPRQAPTSNYPLRAGKGWLYEGGIRVPMIIAWPGRIAPGRTSPLPLLSTDFYPSLLELAGLPARPGQCADGLSIAPLLTGAGAVAERTLFWHFPHYHGSGNRPSGAILDGSLKLLEWFETGGTELYDLARDPGERDDLANRRPADVARLRGMLHRWRAQVDALMPTPDPEWRPEPDAPAAGAGSHGR